MLDKILEEIGRIPFPEVKQDEVLALRRRAKNLRELAERGMCPRKYKKEAERLEEIANERESK